MKAIVCPKYGSPDVLQLQESGTGSDADRLAGFARPGQPSVGEDMARFDHALHRSRIVLRLGDPKIVIFYRLYSGHR
jgi:hypothetical protein